MAEAMNYKAPVTDKKSGSDGDTTEDVKVLDEKEILMYGNEENIPTVK
jgi:hypothetical protein